MPVADRLKISIERSSWIRRMFEEGTRRKALFGADNVFDFSLGNPNLEPPEKLKIALEELIAGSDPGRHAYMPNAGYAATRQAVADYLNRNNNKIFTPEDVVMTVGAGGGLNVVLKTILNPGDEVIIPAPYFMEYDFYLENHQGVPRIVHTRPDFSLDFDAIEKAFTGKTRAVLINSPNNPTGKVYSRSDVEQLGDLLSEMGRKLDRIIYLVSDEPYRKIVYDGIEVPSVFDAYNESFVITSFSKDLSLPGERIGYVACNPDITDRSDLIAGMVLCNRILGYVNAPAMMQKVIPGLLEESVDISIYKRRRDMLCSALSSFGYEFSKPEGAFYLFPRSPVEDDVEFVSALQDENILTVPGTGFGGPGYFRIAYCVSDRTIEGALPGFERVINKY